MKQRTRTPGRILEILAAVFLYAPILVTIIFSFNAEKSQINWGGFSFRWYQSLFENDTILSSLYMTLLLAALSAVIATLVGTASAIGFYAMKAKPRKIFLTVNNIPVINPDIITGVSLMLVFVMMAGAVGGELGFLTLLLAHTTFNIPYVILSVLPKLRQLSGESYEAALDLGATPMRAYAKVIIPQIMPGIASGAIIAFTMSFDDFLISYFTAGSSMQTLPMTIYSMTRKRVTPEVNALSAIMFVAILLLLIGVNVLQKKKVSGNKG